MQNWDLRNTRLCRKAGSQPVPFIGSFARITDIGMKSDKELIQLKNAGSDKLTIGMETADNKALEFMDKGYRKNDILLQCRHLGQTGIYYKFFILLGYQTGLELL